MLCASEGCSEQSSGYDIEKVIDQDNCPVYAVYYECSKGHRFVAEYERQSCVIKNDELST